MGGLVGSVFAGEGGGSTGKAGMNFSAEAAPVIQAVTPEAAQSLQNQAQSALTQQQAFTEALAAQNGIGNQSAIYNQLGDIAAGRGPNPAMAALNQATAANTANQAALMAGQRGAGANTGLMARQAAMQGGANQQAAVGQGATMQAQQSLNALNMQGGIAGQQVGQQAAANQAMLSGTQNEQQNLLNAIAAQNSANVGMRSNQNSSNEGIAQQTARNQQGGPLGNILGGIGSVLGGGKAHGGVIESYATGGQVMQPQVAMPTSIAVPSTPTITAPATGPELSKAVQYMKNQENGATPYIMGSEAAGDNPNDAKNRMSGVKAVGSFMSTIFGGGAGSGSTAMAGGASDAGGITGAAEGGGGAEAALALVAHGGAINKQKVAAMVSPGEMYLPPNLAQAVAHKKASAMSGHSIPGTSHYKGDNLKNDTVPATLEDGGVVIPRSIMDGKDPAKKAAAFVAAHLAKHKRLPKKPD